MSGAANTGWTAYAPPDLTLRRYAVGEAVMVCALLPEGRMVLPLAGHRKGANRLRGDGGPSLRFARDGYEFHLVDWTERPDGLHYLSLALPSGTRIEGWRWTDSEAGRARGQLGSAAVTLLQADRDGCRAIVACRGLRIHGPAGTGDGSVTDIDVELWAAPSPRAPTNTGSGIGVDGKHA